MNEGTEIQKGSGVEKISTMVNRSTCSEGRLKELIDTYEKLVFSICFKIAGDYFTAEDLAQETFLAAFQKYDTFDGSNEKAWICRIATNKSIDYVRSAGRRSVPTEDSFFEAVNEKNESPEDQCIEDEIKQQLKKNCESLKPPYDEIAKAYYLQEMSAAEIAARRKQNLKTIQTQIYRARNMLRGIYGKEEPA